MGFGVQGLGFRVWGGIVLENLGCSRMGEPEAERSQPSMRAMPAGFLAEFFGVASLWFRVRGFRDA